MNHTMNRKHAARKIEKQVVGVFDEAKHRLANLTHEAQAKGEQLVEKAKERGVELLDEVQAGGEQTVKNAKTWISGNPGRATSVAFILGAIATAFLRRGKND